MDFLMDMAHEGGKCVILVTHAMELAELSDCILHMRDGVLPSGEWVS